MCPAQKILSTHTTPVNRRREQVPCSFRTRRLKTVQTPCMRTYIHIYIYIYIYIYSSHFDLDGSRTVCIVDIKRQADFTKVFTNSIPARRPELQCRNPHRSITHTHRSPIHGTPISIGPSHVEPISKVSSTAGLLPARPSE